MPPLAIIGMGSVFPKAEDLGAFWANIKERVDAITAVPDTPLDPADHFPADPTKPDSTPPKHARLLPPTCPLLAGLTPFTGIVASPRIRPTRLRKVEFLKIEERRIYVVLITQSNMVLHKIIEVSETLSQDFLNSVSASLNRQFETEPLDDVREQVLQSLSESHEKYNQLLAQAVRLSRKAFDLTEERQLYVDGQSFIVKEFNDIEKIQRLLETLEEKITLIGLMDNGMDEEGVQVTIGEENPITDLQTCSLITANYSNGGIVLGSIGILGPTRMDYSRVIPIIDYTAKALSEAIANQ